MKGYAFVDSSLGVYVLYSFFCTAPSAGRLNPRKAPGKLRQHLNHWVDLSGSASVALLKAYLNLQDVSQRYVLILDGESINDGRRRTVSKRFW
jgi:hypothetical protein